RPCRRSRSCPPPLAAVNGRLRAAARPWQLQVKPRLPGRDVRARAREVGAPELLDLEVPGRPGRRLVEPAGPEDEHTPAVEVRDPAAAGEVGDQERPSTERRGRAVREVEAVLARPDE